MRAYVQNGYGDYRVLSLKECPEPSINDKQVKIKVKAFSINDWDYGNMTGRPLFNRLIMGSLNPKDFILGADIAGEVVEVGSSVEGFNIGDSVYGDLCEVNFGGFCECIAVEPHAIRHMSKSMTYEDAAAIPQAGMLAHNAMFEFGNIHDGMRILVIGAAGGVGTFIAQIARTYKDIHLTGIDVKEKYDVMASVGYDEFYDYRDYDFRTNGKKYDLIVDNKMSRSVFSYMKSLNDNGTFGTTGGLMRHYMWTFFLSKLIYKLYKKHSKLIILRVNRDLDYFNGLYEKGQLKPSIGGLYPFEDFLVAMKDYSDNKHKGKLVITI